jgi:hypothetical protein
MRVTPAAFSHNGQSPAACATRSRLGPLRSAERFRPAASLGAHTGNRSAANSGSATRPGQAPSLSLMPQLQSSPNGAATPPAVMRTSMSGSSYRNPPAAESASASQRSGRRRWSARGRLAAPSPARSGSPAHRRSASARLDRRARPRSALAGWPSARTARPRAVLQQLHYPADRGRRHVQLGRQRQSCRSAPRPRMP